ncbi:DEAD/DEAH box helicase domain protein [Nitzschia inconspicua]|uniref:DEAD/DEAH box helicase domain protein n=1 Tax=Nitzschia inconspicua TaxID=303405 RepID=A0A9K3KNE8_9STRA|nr:DEAD/DEAH box helicase domain protein [Nitzschia inconspicua]
MSDELDDLFGAIDGEEEGEEEIDPSSDRIQNGTVTANNNKEEYFDVENENDNDKEYSSGEAAAAAAATTTTTTTTTTGAVDTKQLYNSIMYAPTASHLREQQSGTSIMSISSEKQKKQETAAATNEVNTGTSHDKSVRSYSAYPKNLPAGMELPKPTPSNKPAKEYPFTLDPFQAQAVGYIEKEESVLVAAHTSAGKTAVAEYAIAKALNNGQRVVYTSPIKALSNQKFRDLQEEFGDVGLMTGDITINPTATCLVMTTEILRSMLYRGSELMREVAWVIYDEVHYMRDSERGVVWEESIVLLPHRVRFVFLSATIPNASQFADWICEIHHQPCHVVYTNYRPVPLQHYIFPQGGDGLHLVVDERGKFREANFQKAMASLQSGSVDAASADALLSSGNSKKRKRGGGGKKGGDPFSGLHRIIKLIMDRNLNPVIIFSFSKKDCERYALTLNKEDYTDDVEKDLITQVYSNAIDSLGEDDQKLPQVLALLPLLKRGIGVHHGGLLPILKEVVEILFAEGLIKTLFATETFAIGINMPAKTVVFTNTRKFDGHEFRWVTSGEYIQMSGRAGRRGKDDRGLVIQMLDEKMEPAVCKGILYGDPDPLNSSYRISYNMLLNLMRVEDVEPEFLLRASFHQFQREKEAPALLMQAEELEKQAEDVDLGSTEDAELAKEYYKMDQQLLLTKKKVSNIVQKPEYIVKFLQVPGRFLDVSIDDQNYGWGVLTSFKKRGGDGSAGEAGQLASMSNRPMYTLEVLLFCVDRHFDSNEGKTNEEDASNAPLLWRGTSRQCRPAKFGIDDDKIISMRVFTIGLENIDRISAVRIFTPPALQSPEARKKVAMAVKEVQKRFPEGVPLLDPIKDLNIQDGNFTTLMERAEALAKRLSSHKLATDYTEEDRLRLVQAYENKLDLKERARLLRDEARNFQSIAMKDDLKKMKRVLKKLGHVDSNGVIQTKGRTACELNTADELIVTELIFTGVFKTLTVEQSVALLSTLTFGEPINDEDPTSGLKSFLKNPFFKLQEVAKTVVQVQISCGLDVDEDEFLNRINPSMMEAVFAWCKGVKFVDVQKLTGSFEGTTIRTLRRLEELVRQITCAAKAIGDHELEAKFEQGSKLLKRDIVFCNSLYL